MTKRVDPVLLGVGVILNAAVAVSAAHRAGDVEAALYELDTVAETAIALAALVPKHTEPRL